MLHVWIKIVLELAWCSADTSANPAPAPASGCGEYITYAYECAYPGSDETSHSSSPDCSAKCTHSSTSHDTYSDTDHSFCNRTTTVDLLNLI